jgi:hypothetical protein
MSDTTPGQPEPDEVEPTDNSSGAEVDVERLEEIETEDTR